jgi:hypothetical protein
VGHHSGRGTTAAAMVHSVFELQQYLRLVAMCSERRNILILTYGAIIDVSTYVELQNLQYLWLVAWAGQTSDSRNCSGGVGRDIYCNEKRLY